MKSYFIPSSVSVLVDKITQSLTLKNSTLAIFLDLSKTFDTTDHN